MKYYSMLAGRNGSKKCKFNTMMTSITVLLVIIALYAHGPAVMMKSLQLIPLFCGTVIFAL